MILTWSQKPILQLTCIVCLTCAGFAQTLTSIHDLDCAAEGCHPASPSVLVQAPDGNFYGTTTQGGSFGLGTVFKINPAGVLTVLHNFSGPPDGSTPQGGLTLAPDGNFYGTTFAGGTTTGFPPGRGTIFRITPAGDLTILHKFRFGGDGGRPYGAPTLGPDGQLYGVTSIGPNDAAVAYRMSLSGDYQVITSGGLCRPLAPLILGLDGRFYGTSSCGGSNGLGTVFALTSSGTVATIYNFDGTHGADPRAPLVQDATGKLYGATFQGGVENAGAIFKLTLGERIVVLHSFSLMDTNGSRPTAGLVWGGTGFLYGAAEGGGPLGQGVLFRISKAGAYKVLGNFNDDTGTTPSATPIRVNGILYGLSLNGGAFDGGTLYSFTP